MDVQNFKSVEHSMDRLRNPSSGIRVRPVGTVRRSTFFGRVLALLVVAIPTQAGIAEQPTRTSTGRSRHSRSTASALTETRVRSTVLLAQACLPCTPGCFDANTGCQSGTADAACGSGGGACVQCAPDQVCQNRVCVAAFDCTTSCPSGCCSGNQCVAFQSQTNAACGSGGSICLACAAGTVCSGGSCCTPIPLGTACSGHACNEFASDGCGGTYSCDNCPQGTVCGRCVPGQCFNATGSCF
jgi:hypothetical protein